APGVRVQGFTIAPKGVADGDIAVNVAIQGPTGARLLDNVILGGRIGINLGCTSFHSIVSNNTITGQTEAGINIDTCEARPFPGSHHNSIHNNIACSVTSTASIALGGSSNNNKIFDNVATSISAFANGNAIEQNVTQLPIVDQTGNNTLNDN